MKFPDDKTRSLRKSELMLMVIFFVAVVTFFLVINRAQDLSFRPEITIQSLEIEQGIYRVRYEVMGEELEGVYVGRNAFDVFLREIKSTGGIVWENPEDYAAAIIP